MLQLNALSQNEKGVTMLFTCYPITIPIQSRSITLDHLHKAVLLLLHVPPYSFCNRHWIVVAFKRSPTNCHDPLSIGFISSTSYNLWPVPLVRCRTSPLHQSFHTTVRPACGKFFTFAVDIAFYAWVQASLRGSCFRRDFRVLRIAP